MENEIAQKFIEALTTPTGAGFIPKEHLWNLILEAESSHLPAMTQSARIVKRMAEQFDEILEALPA